MPKGTSLAEAESNSEKIKPVVLAVIELRWSEGIGQTISQSAENPIKQKIPLFRKCLKFCGNFLKAFRINLKVCLGLTNTTPLLFRKLRLVFECFYFMGHAYFLVVPTMNHYCGS